MTDYWFDIGTTIGPCSEEAAGKLATAILDLTEAQAVFASAVSVVVLDTRPDDVTITVGRLGRPHHRSSKPRPASTSEDHTA